ncbi:MAG: hypothetical protein DWQ02_02685 [Bacteroidetes bacterium]|nr:MAG: hypothetical protein DWQ02_02685 [Bacteroidota bacterium]
MEIHLQRCQNCQSDEVRNILYRQEGERDRVFVQCAKCNEFVASYKIGPMGYYHHGKGYESFLRGLHRSGEFASGRKMAQLYSQRKEEESQMFSRALDLLRKREASKLGKQNKEV